MDQTTRGPSYGRAVFYWRGSIFIPFRYICIHFRHYRCYLSSTSHLGWFLKKLGHMRTMTIILIVMGIRLLGYSFLVNPWMTLPIDLLNGLTLGLYWATVIYFFDSTESPVMENNI